MEIVLMRHGKAEDRALDTNDAERKLTAKGKAKTEISARGLKRIMDPACSIRIWSSPLIRAYMTAEIVAKVFGGVKVETYEALATGRLELLAEQLAELTAADSLIIVGHQPFLGLWAARIADVVIPFKPSAAACFDMSSLDPLEGKLRWMAEADVLGRMD